MKFINIAHFKLNCHNHIINGTSIMMWTVLEKSWTEPAVHSFYCYIFIICALTLTSPFAQDTSIRAKLPPTNPLASRSGLTITQPFKFCNTNTKYNYWIWHKKLTRDVSIQYAYIQKYKNRARTRKFVLYKLKSKLTPAV